MKRFEPKKRNRDKLERRRRKTYRAVEKSMLSMHSRADTFNNKLRGQSVNHKNEVRAEEAMKRRQGLPSAPIECLGQMNVTDRTTTWINSDPNIASTTCPNCWWPTFSYWPRQR